jgi:hypothetical protein
VGNLKWKPAENKLARILCSSIEAANNCEAFQVSLGQWEFWVVNGFHPVAPDYPKSNADKAVLEALFHDMYSPCVVPYKKSVLTSLQSLMQATENFICAVKRLKDPAVTILYPEMNINWMEWDEMFTNLLGSLEGFKEALLILIKSFMDDCE